MLVLRRGTAVHHAGDRDAGEHLLRVRAHDGTGRSQPVEPPWNRGGFTNNAAEALRVAVPG